MIKKIDHVVITTRDVGKCISFYEGLGFKIIKGSGRLELYAGDFKINVHLLNHELEPHATNVKTGSADFCFEIDNNLEQFRNELIEKGYTIYLGIVDRTGVRGEMQSIYLYDPDGNLIEFSKYNV